MGPMNIKLINANPLESEDDVCVEQLPIILGRASEAGIQLNDPWVSRRHCVVDQQGGALIIRDQGSTHGTFVNGHPVTEAVLRPGDKLVIGMSTFIVDYDSSTVEIPAGVSA